MKKLFKNQKGFTHFELFLTLLFFAAIAVVGVYVAKDRFKTVAAAPTLPPNATLMAGQIWMIKSNDLKVIGNNGSYEWVGCGTSTAPLAAVNYTPCQPGQVPIYTNEATFANDVNNGTLTRGSTVIFDDEQWKLTPLWEQQHQIYYQQLAAQLASSHGITFINTPFNQSTDRMITLDKAAAQAGASVVEIQAQEFDSDPAHYKSFVLKDVAAIRSVNPNVIILAGLATDATGSPTSATSLYKSYQNVKNSVQGFWLNANTWGPPHARGCASTGCPAVALQFLQMIGVPIH